MDPIIIDIRGGVAYVIRKPIGIELIMRDFDLLEEEENSKTNNHDETYLEDVYESHEEVDEDNQ